MTEDKITLTPSQLASWLDNPENTAPHKSAKDVFDSLKAHVEKKVRREFWIQSGTPDYIFDSLEEADKAWDKLSPNRQVLPIFHVREAFPGDILKTEEEANASVEDIVARLASDRPCEFYKRFDTIEDYCRFVRRVVTNALGLEEGRSE